MDVKISPADVKSEDFGFLKGKVLSVSESAASPQELDRILNNQAQDPEVHGAGAVHRVRRADPGYRPEERLRLQVDLGRGAAEARSPAASFCTYQVVVDQKRPISYVIPMVKKTLGDLSERALERARIRRARRRRSPQLRSPPGRRTGAARRRPCSRWRRSSAAPPRWRMILAYFGRIVAARGAARRVRRLARRLEGEQRPQGGAQVRARGQGLQVRAREALRRSSSPRSCSGTSTTSSSSRGSRAARSTSTTRRRGRA